MCTRLAEPVARNTHRRHQFPTIFNIRSSRKKKGKGLKKKRKKKTFAYRRRGNIFTRAHCRIFIYCAVIDGWLAASLHRDVMFLSRWHAYKDLGNVTPSNAGGKIERRGRVPRAQAERMAHVAASLSARPVLHHRSADRKRGTRTRCNQTRKSERDREKDREREWRDTRAERRTCSILTGRGAHILISTRSPSYYWFEINRPFRG